MRSFLILFMLVSLPSLAQTRLLSHVTRTAGGFETLLILENESVSPQSFTLTPYLETGEAGAEVGGVLEPLSTVSISPEELFPNTANVSHIVIGSGNIRLFAAYTATAGNGSPAHVSESAEQAGRYRLFSGNWERVFDGFAVVNTGQNATQVRVIQRDQDGNVVREIIAVNQLEPMAKGLVVIGGPGIEGMDAPANSVLEIAGSEPLALTVLRGTLPDADFLWVNPAEPSAPGMVKVIDDAPEKAGCIPETQLGANTPDLNNLPQGEVMIDVAPDGRLVATSKDFRYSPVDDVTYNARVWNGLYSSSDQGATWRYQDMHDGYPDAPLPAITNDVFELSGGQPVNFSRLTDPVVAFDRDSNLYTTALSYAPSPNGNLFASPSAITGGRRNQDGMLETLHFFGTENSPNHFNDKNWIAVDRSAPRESTTVAIAWRAFIIDEDNNEVGNGFVVVSGDGAETFTKEISLPVPESIRPRSQWFQPLIGKDPETGRKTLYVIFRESRFSDFSIQMHVLKADIELDGGTAALEAHLSNEDNWTFYIDRLPYAQLYSSGGYDGRFRFGSSFLPVIDPDTGHIYVVASLWEPIKQVSRIRVAKSENGGGSWSFPMMVDDAPEGLQLMPAVAFANGLISLIWYDTRHDPATASFEPVNLIDVYYAEVNPDLTTRRTLRVTKASQRGDLPVFTRPRASQSKMPYKKEPAIHPHEFGMLQGLIGTGLPILEESWQPKMTVCDPYGFIGDYIGIAADDEHSYLVWADMRDLNVDAPSCAEGDCAGARNQNIYYARIPKE